MLRKDKILTQSLIIGIQLYIYKKYIGDIKKISTVNNENISNMLKEGDLVYVDKLTEYVR